MNLNLDEIFSCGQIEEEQSLWRALLLNILSKYSQGFVSLLEGRNEDKLLSELHGGARILYIFQSIFVDRLEEVDQFGGLMDEDILTTIQNASGPRSTLFVPEVPFLVLIRRQIAQLLNPSLHCARLVYNELVKMSHSILVHELQQFPLLRLRIDEVVGEFLVKGLGPSLKMIENIIDMEIDFINTSHPSFIGGSKAVEVALQHVRSYKMSTPMPRLRDGVDADAVQASESRTNGIINDKGVRSGAAMGLNGVSGRRNVSKWVSSFFRGKETHTPPVSGIFRSNGSDCEPVYQAEHTSSSTIYLREPPMTLRTSEVHSEQEAVSLAVTKQLLASYYSIVRKNIEDSVPKAIMHFLVNRIKRELHNILITELYSDNFVEEFIRETEEATSKRYHAQKALRAFKQASKSQMQGKNISIIMPDASADAALDDLVSAGDRCMMLSRAVSVGDSVPRERELVDCAKSLKVNAGIETGLDLGPVISEEVPRYERGNFLAPTNLSDVTTSMECYKEEMYGPVLLCMKFDRLEEAIAIINKNKNSHGSSIFTTSTAAVAKFPADVETSLVEINGPAPVSWPLPSCNQSNTSVAGDLNFSGKEELQFYTQRKTVAQQWKDLPGRRICPPSSATEMEISNQALSQGRPSMSKTELPSSEPEQELSRGHLPMSESELPNREAVHALSSEDLPISESEVPHSEVKHLCSSQGHPPMLESDLPSYEVEHDLSRGDRSMFESDELLSCESMHALSSGQSPISESDLSYLTISEVEHTSSHGDHLISDI